MLGTKNMNNISEYGNNELALVSINVASRNGKMVWFAYRAEPNNHKDSGWVFHGPNENDEFSSNPSNLVVVPVKSMLIIDKKLVEIIDKPIWTCWERYADNGLWFQVNDFFNNKNGAQQGDAPEPASPAR